MDENALAHGGHIIRALHAGDIMVPQMDPIENLCLENQLSFGEETRICTSEPQ